MMMDFRKSLLVLVLLVFPQIANASLRPIEVSSSTGTKAWYIEDRNIPAISLVIHFKKAGFAYDPSGKEGLAGVFAKMLDEGTTELDSKEFNRRIEDLAIQLGVSIDEDDLSISLRTLSKNKDAALKLLAGAINSPRLAEEDLARVKTEVESTIKFSEQNPSYVAEKEWKKAMYGAHPYSRVAFPEIGSIKTITVAELKNYKAINIARDNVIVSVVGDISQKEVADFLELTFGKLPEKQKVESEVAEATYAKASQSLKKSEIPQSVVVFGHKGIKRNNPDYIPFYVLNQIFGSGSFASRLMEEVREKSGLTYGIGTGLESQDYSGLLTGSFSTKNEDAAKAIAKVKEEFNKLHDKGVTGAELKDAKNYITGSFALNLDTNMKVAQFLTTMQRYSLGIDYLEKRNQLFEAVTIEQVNRLSKDLLKPDELIFSIVGNPAGI